MLYRRATAATFFCAISLALAAVPRHVLAQVETERNAIGRPLDVDRNFERPPMAVMLPGDEEILLTGPVAVEHDPAHFDGAWGCAACGGSGGADSWDACPWCEGGGRVPFAGGAPWPWLHRPFKPVCNLYHHIHDKIQTVFSEPLEGTSWHNRPFYADAFLGVLFGDSLIAGRVEQEAGLLRGFRIGHDLGPKWGWATCFSFASADVVSPAGLPLASTAEIFF